MTVGELIAALQQKDQNEKVLMYIDMRKQTFGNADYSFPIHTITNDENTDGAVLLFCDVDELTG